MTLIRQQSHVGHGDRYSRWNDVWYDANSCCGQSGNRGNAANPADGDIMCNHSLKSSVMWRSVCRPADYDLRGVKRCYWQMFERRQTEAELAMAWSSKTQRAANFMASWDKMNSVIGAGAWFGGSTAPPGAYHAEDH